MIAIHGRAPLRFGEWTRAELKAAYTILGAELALIEKAAPLTPDDYEHKFRLLRQSLADQMAGYAEQLARGRLSASQFRQYMTATIRRAYVQAFTYGSGSVAGRAPLTDMDLVTINRYIADELPYLDHFAQQIRANHYSEAYLLNRTSLYADAIRSLYWAGKVSRQATTTVIWWHAADDENTCDPCAAADAGSPYQLGDLPGLPGADICDGLDRCRCFLRFEPVAIERPAFVQTAQFRDLQVA